MTICILQYAVDDKPWELSLVLHVFKSACGKYLYHQEQD